MADPVVVELLQKIVENTGKSDSLWIAVIAGGSAVFGAGISALTAYVVASRAGDVQLRAAQAQASIERQKLRASVVTAERLRWLQDLRSKVAEFYSYIDMQVMHIARSFNPNAQAIPAAEMDVISKEAGSRGNQILLMLNPENEEQQALFSSVNSALTFVNDAFKQATLNKSPPDRTAIAKIKTQSFSSMHKIGRKAWDKVQGLE